MIDENGRLLSEVGDLLIAPVGWPEGTLDPGPGDLLRYPQPKSDQVKGDRGRVVILGGGPYHGAPLLAGMAAARMGCDLVHVAMPTNAASRAKWPSELIPESMSDEDIISNIDSIIERCLNGRGVQALVIGPGMGDNPLSLEAVNRLIEATPEIPKVIDADAIKALNGWPSSLVGVVTPHQKELENWVWDEANIPKMLEGHGEMRVVIKTGAEDLIFGAGGRGGVVEGGNPRMSMGGSGDLLAGCIGGLLALGLTPWSASRVATYAMRKAGEMAGEQIGPGLVAEDIPPYLSRALITGSVLLHQPEEEDPSSS